MEWYIILSIVIGSLVIYSILVGACMAAAHNLGIYAERNFEEELTFTMVLLPIMVLVVLGTWIYRMFVNKK